jgi:hypothetical protein
VVDSEVCQSPSAPPALVRRQCWSDRGALQGAQPGEPGSLQSCDSQDRIRAFGNDHLARHEVYLLMLVNIARDVPLNHAMLHHRVL